MIKKIEYPPGATGSEIIDKINEIIEYLNEKEEKK